MKAIASETLLDELSNDIRQILRQTESLKQLSAEKLKQNPKAGSWSIAQCLQHLNIYCEHYLPAIESGLSNQQHSTATQFKSGWLGNYFTNLMRLDNNGNTKKMMKAPKNAIPSSQPDGEMELKKFIEHQHHLLNLFNLAKKSDLNKIRIPISLTKLIRLKLGDTFLFFSEHQKRHFVQINRALKMIQ
jgi:hypothetical protein